MPERAAAASSVSVPGASPDGSRAFLRHAVATLAYRAAKAIRHAPPEFAEVRAAPTSRSAQEILSHMADLLDWALSQARGEERWQTTTLRSWTDEVDRFVAAMRAFDQFLARGEPLARTPEVLFQGAIADALTHAGQLALLRRLADAPLRGENFALAEIVPGRISLEQAAPRAEFGR